MATKFLSVDLKVSLHDDFISYSSFFSKKLCNVYLQIKTCPTYCVPPSSSIQRCPLINGYSSTKRLKLKKQQQDLNRPTSVRQLTLRSWISNSISSYGWECRKTSGFCYSSQSKSQKKYGFELLVDCSYTNTPIHAVKESRPLNVCSLPLNSRQSKSPKQVIS